MYQTTTLSQFATQISQLLDDPLQRFWTQAEIILATYEGLLVWGAETSYWRSRGVIQTSPGSSPYCSLEVQLPLLRPRSITLNQVVKEIQYMLLENPSGLPGTGMSGQVAIGSIIQAVLDARNRFVLDTHLPISLFNSGIAPTDGLIPLPPTIVYVHSAYWVDNFTGQQTPMWREDAWSADKNNIIWNLDPGIPRAFSEAELAPLKLQLVPPPLNVGFVHGIAVAVSPITIINDPTLTLGMPDEWVHAIKYSALAQLLSADSQIKDPVRAEYAAKRYDQAIEFAKQARSVMRVLLEAAPLNIDTLAAMDAGDPYWRNSAGRPKMCGVLYDTLIVNPGRQDRIYSLSVDVARAAPLPTLAVTPAGDQFIQMGPEDLASLQRYVTHILSFKCGGHDLQSTYSDYDSFMRDVSVRKSINTVKIKYLQAALGQVQKEWSERPDLVPARQ